MVKYLLGIDAGLTNIKVVLFDFKGKQIAVSKKHHETINPRSSWVEGDPEILWENTADGIHEAIQRAGIDSKEIGAVGVAGFGLGLFVIDTNGRAVRNAVCSNDNRAVDVAEMYKKDGSYEKIARINSTPTISGQPGPILRWIKENEPDHYAQIAHVLMCKDYIRFRLTGDVVSEYVDMSAGGLLDLGTKAYSEELMDL